MDGYAARTTHTPTSPPAVPAVLTGACHVEGGVCVPDTSVGGASGATTATMLACGMLHCLPFLTAHKQCSFAHVRQK